MAQILLIDDSIALLAQVAQFLARGGHAVTALSDGRAALQYLRCTEVDLVITDLCMPEPDGFEVIAAVRAIPRRIPIVVMSAQGSSCAMFRAARALGAAITLPKPFDAPQLEVAVNLALAGPDGPRRGERPCADFPQPSNPLQP